MVAGGTNMVAIEKQQVRTIRLRECKALDPITIYLEDFDEGQGMITIVCYGKAWSSYWGGMSDRNIAEFFCSCDEHYIAKNLSDIDSEVYDIDTLQRQAAERGIDCYRDDPWNDYEFMNEMYGGDMYDWYDSLPKMTNPDYRYLCRIILAVQEGLKESGEA